MSSALIAVLLMCSVPEPAASPSEVPALGYFERGTLSRATWDMTLDFHLGRVGSRMDWAAFMGKVRVGGLWVQTPWALGLGVQVQLSNVEVFTFGFESELTHVATGFWGQLGLVGDVRGRGGLTAGLGWSIIGVSAGVRGGTGFDPDWSLYFMVRVPVGLFALLAR